MTAGLDDKPMTNDQGLTAAVGGQALDLLLPGSTRPDLNRRYRLERAEVAALPDDVVPAQPGAGMRCTRAMPARSPHA